MSELIAAKANVKQMTIDDRVALARSLVSQIQENWTRLAEVVWSLRQDGYDTEDLCIPLCGFLEKAARGAMLIDAIQLWYYNESLLRYFAKLPIIDQKRLVKDKAISVIEGESDRMIQLGSIRADQLRIAFEVNGGTARIRTIPEQAAMLNNAKIIAKTKRQRKIIYDPNGDTIDTDGPKSRKELIEWLKEKGLNK